MQVTVQLFGPLAEQAGRSRLEVSVSGSSVGDVVDAVRRAEPALKLDAVRFAVGTEYVERAAPVREGDVVSLIPPVGGG